MPGGLGLVSESCFQRGFSAMVLPCVCLTESSNQRLSHYTQLSCCCAFILVLKSKSHIQPLLSFKKGYGQACGTGRGLSHLNKCSPGKAVGVPPTAVVLL